MKTLWNRIAKGDFGTMDTANECISLCIGMENSIGTLKVMQAGGWFE